MSNRIPLHNDSGVLLAYTYCQKSNGLIVAGGLIYMYMYIHVCNGWANAH